MYQWSALQPGTVSSSVTAVQDGFDMESFPSGMGIVKNLMELNEVEASINNMGPGVLRIMLRVMLPDGACGPNFPARAFIS